MEFNLNKFKERILTIDSLGLLYILVVGGLCHILPIPEIVKGFLALHGFLIIPYLVGINILPLIKKKLSFEFDIDFISKFIISWCIGILMILLFSLLLYSCNLFDLKSFVLLLLIILVLRVYSNPVKEMCYLTKIKTVFALFGNKNIPLLLIFFGIVPVLYVTQFLPYPLSPMTDIFSLNFATLEVIENNIILFTDGYLPVQWLISAIIALIFNVDPFSFTWTSKFLFYILYVIGVYLFIYTISKNIKLSLISSFISVWILPPDLTLYYFLPRTELYILFPFVLFLFYRNIINIIKKDNISLKNILLVLIFTSLCSLLFFSISYLSENIGRLFGIVVLIFFLCTFFISKILLKDTLTRKIFFILFIVSITCISIHIPMGSLVVFVIILYLFISVFLCYHFTKTKTFIYILFFIVFLFLFLQKIEIISVPLIDTYLSGYDYYSPYKIPTFTTIYNFVIGSYSLPILILFLLGITSAIIHKKQKKTPLIFLISIIFLISFLPISSMYRMLFLTTPFVVYFVAYFIIFLDVLIKKISKKYATILHLFYTFLIIVILINLVIVPQTNNINHCLKATGMNICSTFNMHEYLAFKWLKLNVSQNVIPISEQQTLIQIKGITNNKNILFPIDKYSHEQNIFNILKEKNADTAYFSIMNLFKNKSLYINPNSQGETNSLDRKIMIIGPKTANFAMHGNTFWIWYTCEFKRFEGFAKFFDTTYFTLLYNDSNQIYIFGVNPEPGIPFKLINNSNF